MTENRDIRRIRLSRTAEERHSPFNIDWRAELNEQQYAAVTAPLGATLVLAGAGSGKTRVIVYRIAYLIGELRINPRRIMMTTFTNKAAKSMLDRAEALIGRPAREITGGTFHSIANLVLRRYSRHIGFNSSFTILDSADQRQVMKLCRTEAGIEGSGKSFPSDRVLVDIGSAMVNTNTDLESLLSARYPHLYDQYAEIQRVLILYTERKFQSNQMDFDDLLINWLKLLQEHPGVRRRLCGRFTQLLVDEYQDVNHIQAEIVKWMNFPVTEKMMRERAETFGDPRGEEKPAVPVGDDESDVPAPLPAASASDYDSPSDSHSVSATPSDPFNAARFAGQQIDIMSTTLRTEVPEPNDDLEEPVEDSPEAPQGRSLFVVGDDAQSIFSFRGADFRNILSFPTSFPGANICKLETNYRSTPQVLDLANAILGEGPAEFKKQLVSVKPSSEDRPLLVACNSREEQAEFVCEQILSLREEHQLDYKQIAVLYRAHANRLEVELEFTRRGIPFVVRGGLRFFEQAHLKDVLSYLLVLANSHDELAWQRMLEMCDRVGPKTVAGVVGKLRVQNPLQKFIYNGVVEGVRGKAKETLGELKSFLEKLEPEALTTPPSELIRRVIDERYSDYLQMKWENWRQRLDDLEQLEIFANQFDTVTAFLAEIGLNGSFSGSELQGQEVEGADDPEEGAVTLSTIHQAKGLEWHTVFLVHVQDDVIPHRMSRTDPEGEDEERRLFYVAVTRAEQLLFMSYPMISETHDFQRIINRPSRFLTKLPDGSYDEAQLEWNDNDW
ncbi:MAG: ATP-dependent helicase [Planctomycetales bacterium]|nr:ATP-dependent helicase [bacterium]UNM08754.1 MAG: ATP-dependent helicase [Planctomycetales bacterium]